MATNSDYRNSHTAPEYGRDYHNRFQAPGYRKYLWEVERNILKDIVNDFFNGKIQNYLDFACGTGRVLSFLESSSSRSVGLDISNSMLETAKNEVQSSNLICGDITRESNLLNGQVFDLITAFRFFLRAQPKLRDEVMGKLVENLAVDGHIVFNIHNNKTSVSNIISKLYTKIKYGSVKVRDEMSFDEVETLTANHGLVIVKTYPYSTFPIFRENRPFSKKLVQFSDNYFAGKILSTYIIYVCRKK